MSPAASTARLVAVLAALVVLCTGCGKTDADCREAMGCGMFGACAAHGGVCVASEDSECKRSEHCRDFGRCTAKGGECVATREEDCKNSSMCRLNGQCGFGDGRCR